MDFTEIYRQTSSLVAFSAGAHFILTAIQDRVIVRRADTFHITRTWLVDASPTATHSALLTRSTSKAKASTATTSANAAQENWVTHVGWSCDSEYILAACAKRGVVHIFKLRDEEWSGRIDAGAEGLVRAEWAPDGRTVLCFSEWGLRVTLWSLVTGTATYIQYPVHPDKGMPTSVLWMPHSWCSEGYAFRTDGRYFLLAERHKSKDTLGVYDASESYKLVRHFPLPTSSVASFSLSPTGSCVAAWDGPLEYKLCILTLAGDLLATFTPDPDPGFGVHILDSLTWSPAASLELTSRIPSTVRTWREPSGWLEATEGRGFLSYERLQGIQTLSIGRSDLSKPYPKCGVIQLEFNTTGSLLLVRFENTPNTLHIFDFPSPQEPFLPHLRTVLIHQQPIQHARWNPVRKGSLSLCCGTQSVYVWSDEWAGDSGQEEEMAECIGVPAKNFEARDLRWAPDGKGFILLDRDQFCCAFEVEDEAY
ncbi:WD repeat-containing protein 8 [Ephemerocybe angulata]|uniref:WD repeat-containing protein 8 n=1 Tax=Ephemerocybe angulata TaxID=980116 RepID=A0A8H6IKS7_9AGAR|nr:WD repeat-containing protein 8 [Tulosesus angulatus]